MGDLFSRFVRIDVPNSAACEFSGENASFEIAILADGEIPFLQVILYAEGRQHLIKDEMIKESNADAEADGQFAYVASVLAGLVGPREISVQVEGCRKAEFHRAGDGDWFAQLAGAGVSGVRRFLSKNIPASANRHTAACVAGFATFRSRHQDRTCCAPVFRTRRPCSVPFQAT